MESKTSIKVKSGSGSQIHIATEVSGALFPLCGVNTNGDRELMRNKRVKQDAEITCSKCKKKEH